MNVFLLIVFIAAAVPPAVVQKGVKPPVVGSCREADYGI